MLSMALRLLQPIPLLQPTVLLQPMPRLHAIPVGAYRRSARRTYGTATVYTPGSGPPPYSVSAQTYASQRSGPWEWHAGPGPRKRGGECVTDVDINRGYGFRGPCPPGQRGALNPQPLPPSGGGAGKRAKRATHAPI